MAEVLMVGPKRASKGGINSVINTYMRSSLCKNNKIRFLGTYDARGLHFTIISYARAILILPWILMRPSLKVVHIHTASRGSFLRKSIIVHIARLFNKKVILHIHSGEFLKFYNRVDKLRKAYIRYTLRKSLVIALAKSWKKNIMEILGNKGDVRILYNPIETREINNTGKTKDILFLGLLREKKGVFDLIEAVKKLDDLDFRLLLGGTGDSERVKKEIKGTPSENKVKLLGWVAGEKKRKTMRGSCIYVLPSYFEGLPISVLEAMSYGIPVISTPVGGIPEAVEDGKSGFLIQPGDTKALAEKISYLIRNPRIREKMGKEGHRIAKERFDIKKIAGQLQEIYDSL